MHAAGTAQQTLSRPAVHEEWKSTYRTSENEPFFELAFDYIAERLSAAKGATILDAGCGTASHSLRLARRGFSVHGIDFSGAVLPEARANAERQGYPMTLEQMDVTALKFADGAFSYALCWGVLMHIPNVERAVSELCRVTAPGGWIVVGENNYRSLESVMMRTIRRVLGRNRAKHVPAGMETWVRSEAGDFLQRDADPRWLIQAFRAHGMQLMDHRARQWTELYRFMPRAMRKAVHAFNNFWFRRIGAPATAIGQLLIFKKVE